MQERQGIGQLRGYDAALGTAGQPFYQVKIPLTVLPQLTQILSSASAGRGGLSITTDYHDPNRLRITRVAPPGYEAAAANRYVRGNLSISGRAGASCNIDLSVKSGAKDLISELQSAGAVAASYVLVRVPSRGRHLVEVIPDLELVAAADDFAQAGAALAGHVLPAEDFAEWESSAPVSDAHGS